VSVSIDGDAVQIAADVIAAGSAQRAASGQRYLNSTMEFSGTAVPDVRRIVTTWRRTHPHLSASELTALATALWEGPVFECRLAAVVLLADRRALLRPRDAAFVEQLLRASGTWALADSLAADVMGSLIERYPELLATLDRWATDDDFWIRRSALLSLLVPLRRGDPANFERFTAYADVMLGDREFFIRKAIGRVLREAGKRQPHLVATWLAPRAAGASGVTMREAVKWLPAGQRDALLAAHRAGSSGQGGKLGPLPMAPPRNGPRYP
jgi:3-methyladenine DNA glycosylase AlkD